MQACSEIKLNEKMEANGKQLNIIQNVLDSVFVKFLHNICEYATLVTRTIQFDID